MAAGNMREMAEVTPIVATAMLGTMERKGGGGGCLYMIVRGTMGWSVGHAPPDVRFLRPGCVQ